jgi:seryl-tRNA synthetase
MIDIRLLREKPEMVKAAIARKKFDCDVDAILELDVQRRAIVTEAEQKRARQKAASNEMAELPKGSPEFQARLSEMKALSAEVKALQQQQTETDEAFQKAFLTLPNLPDASVPDGNTEEDNVVFSTHGNPSDVSPFAIPHYDIPWFSQLVDLKRGTKVTGAGFPFFVGDVARMVRSLIQFFLDENSKAGYVEFMPPIMVNPASATATGQLPDKESQMYYVGLDDLYLIPTSEVPVTNFYRDEIFDHLQLPVYHTAYTPNFRREAGSYGKEVRGLNRVHQFDKVEIVKWVHPDESFDELDSLRAQAESLLVKLGLPFRTLLMCSKDIGFPHAKQYDLEVWAGGQKRWLEVSSCSNFTDFQARRANIRFRDAEGKLRIVHTLNGSSLAVPRVLAAILENNLLETGEVKVPEILQERVGKDRIGFKHPA